MAVIDTVAVLNADEVRRAVTDVHSERARWITHGTGTSLEFHTLGAALYLDAAGGRFASHQSGARRLNHALMERFAWLYERVRAAVSSALGAPVRFDEGLALPGFHIFLHDLERPPATPKLHFDLQYRHVDWTRFGLADLGAPLSLTLALALPRSGGGLLAWNINLGELQQMDRHASAAYLRANRTATRHAYTAGSLALHSGHQLHQIAPTPDPQAGDQRITMQGHAMRVDGTWLVYW